MVISNMFVLLILVLVSPEDGLADVVTYDVACGASCEKKCADKGFKFEKCQTGARYSSDKHDPSYAGKLPNYCSCTTPPCTNAKERCKDALRSVCEEWKGSVYCNPKRNQCECTCDPVKCSKYCVDNGNKPGAKCEEDISFGLKCMCKESSGPKDCDTLIKQTKALSKCVDKHVEYRECYDFGKLVCDVQPKEVTKNRNPCKCNCNAEKCTEYCTKRNKTGKCKPLDTDRAIKYNLRGETCKCT